MNADFDISGMRRWVLKIGSSLITDVSAGLNERRINSWVRQVDDLKNNGLEIVIVSSGSIVEGMKRLGWRERPTELHLLQVAAAVGQMGLVRAYESAFDQFGHQTAQVLLTNADIANRSRYLNARNTLRKLLELGIIPIVNENDTVVTDEIRLGDNDTLASLVANIVDADLLIILTDQNGLYESDPRYDSSAKLIKRAQSNDPNILKFAGPGNALGRGGMATKVEAARKAARSGAATVIASGLDDVQLQKIYKNEFTGTLLLPKSGRMAARKQWIAGNLHASGTLHLDPGAVKALAVEGRSLLPVGIKSVEGTFDRGDLVVCVCPESKEIAKGLTNYNSTEADKLKGHRSDRIEQLLGYGGEHEIIHRDNLVLMY